MLRRLSLLLALGLTALPMAAQSEELIALRYATFDPIEGEPAVAPELSAVRNPGLFLVQFADKPSNELRNKIRAAGGEVVGFVPHRAQLVRMPERVADAVRSMEGVRWVGAYHPAYRLDPELIAEGVVGRADQRAAYNIVLVDKRTDRPALIEALRGLGGKILHRQPGSLLVEAELDGAQLLRAAALPQTLWIDRVTAKGHDMDFARDQGGADHIEALGGYLGQGVNGHIYEGLEDTHPDFSVRPTPVLSCNLADDHGHATAGIVFGNGTSHPHARGMAPAMTPFFTNDLCVPTGTSRWQVVDQLVNVHEVMFTTASWGNGLTANYTSITADADDIVFDHGIPWTQSQSNSGSQQSRPQAWAKNLISVGGVRHFENADPNDDSWSGGASIGPAADGRLKPDLCAYYDAVHTSDRTGALGYSLGDDYTSFGGTSAATPIVAGHNALAIQMFTDGLFSPQRVPGGSRFDNRPNFTTLKALQIASASQYAFTELSADNRREHQGWGFPSLRTMYDDRALMHVVDETRPLQQGEAARYRIQVAPGRSDLAVCMTFADPAANPAAALARVNDLHLRVIDPTGQVYWGNHGLRAGMLSVSGGQADTVDTVECVRIAAPIAGVWHVDVVADLVVVDNHLATAAVDADFGLVVRGGVFLGEGQAGTATAFGSGCPGSMPGDPENCVVRNDALTLAPVALRANATYALELVAAAPVELVGFELYCSSAAGLPTSMPAHVRLPDGLGLPTVTVGTGTLTADPAPGWRSVDVAPVSIAAGQTFYVCFDAPAAPPVLWDAVQGGVDVPYYRQESGVWSGRQSGRFEWGVRVRCVSATRRTPKLSASGVYDVGHAYDLVLSEGLPFAFAGIAIGSSRQSYDGVPLPLALDFLGAPGCSVYTNVLALDGAILDAGGAMRIHLAIPNLAQYLGARIFHQGVVLDPAASAFGFVFSGGYEVVLGG